MSARITKDELTPLIKEAIARLQRGLEEPVLGQVVGAVHDTIRSGWGGGETPWAPLAKPTATNEPLIRTGTLFASLTEPDGPFGYVEHRSPWTLAVGTHLWYAYLHEHGTRKMPARPPVPEKLAESDTQHVVTLVGAWIIGGGAS